MSFVVFSTAKFVYKFKKSENFEKSEQYREFRHMTKNNVFSNKETTIEFCHIQV